MKHNITIVLGLIIAITTIATFAQNKKKVEMPKAITGAFQKAYPNAKLLSFSKEKEKGQVQYEVESQDGATRRDLIYDVNGNVLEIEEVISAEDLPAVIKQVLEKDYKNAIIVKAETLVRGDVLAYELSMKKGNKKFGLTFDKDGTLKK
ncbi:MAG: PepSY-like domain-containing protein [Ignavibacteriales bacterium]|nr:PepSY-like domain-containing protein [Ignavibacteriales bacterium]